MEASISFFDVLITGGGTFLIGFLLGAITYYYFRGLFITIIAISLLQLFLDYIGYVTIQYDNITRHFEQVYNIILREESLSTNETVLGFTGIVLLVFGFVFAYKYW